MLSAVRIDSLAAKAGSVIANLASVLGFAFYIADRTSTLPPLSGPMRLNVVLHLAILSAIAFGILWSLTERCFRWNIGGGGHRNTPSGCPAVRG